MNKVVIHTKLGCKYCTMAKEFLKTNKVVYKEVEYDPNAPDYTKRALALTKTTRHPTFPQVYIGPFFIGGYTELVASYKPYKA